MKVFVLVLDTIVLGVFQHERDAQKEARDLVSHLYPNWIEVTDTEWQSTLKERLLIEPHQVH